LPAAHAFVFPSLQDIGADVVYEAQAAITEPIVTDLGGPGDIVHSKIGYKLPITKERDIVAQMQKVLTELAHNRDRLERLRRQGIAYVREGLTWEAKAESVTRVLNWAVGRGPKPDLPPPKMLHLERASWS